MNLLDTKKIFVIAEMANSHEGNLDNAKKIVEAASNAGANAIKFQRFTADELAEPQHENYALYKKLEMSDVNWKELVKFAKKMKMRVFVDVFGIKSATALLKLDIDGFKIHSSDISNPHILNFFSKIKKPILLSTAGCLLNEIDEALKILQKTPKEIVLMHGFQGYPTALEDTNLLRISRLKKKYRLPLGIMDHISGGTEMVKIVPLLAIASGVTIIEKHINLDRSKKGLDHYSSLNPDEFSDFVSLVRLTEKALGTSEFDLTLNEKTYRLAHKKNPISKQIIKKGVKFTEKILDFKRTKTKESVSWYELRNRVSAKNIPRGVSITPNMLDHKSHKVAAIIACRVHSDRMFAKQLQLVGDKPILGHVIDQLRRSTLIDEIILGISERTGNEIFIDFAKKHGIKFIIGDDTDVLKRLIDGAKYVNADIVFRITPENPFIYWEAIDNVIKKHIKGKFDFSFVYDLPLGSGFEVISLKALEISHNLGSSKHRSELCSLYIRENKKKFRIHRFLPPKELQRQELRLTVDTPEDLVVARIIHHSLSKKERIITVKKVVEFLDKNPHIAKINSQVALDVSRIWIPNDPLR